MNALSLVVTTGILTTLLTLTEGWLREVWRDKSREKSEATYLAMRIAVILEGFVIGCLRPALQRVAIARLAAALRRSELVTLDVADVAVVAEGLRITVRRSKTDQDAIGEVVGVSPHRHG
jgi:hypothetical protein